MDDAHLVSFGIAYAKCGLDNIVWYIWSRIRLATIFMKVSHCLGCLPDYALGIRASSSWLCFIVASLIVLQ
jgi:hypothetical protein